MGGQWEVGHRRLWLLEPGSEPAAPAVGPEPLSLSLLLRSLLNLRLRGSSGEVCAICCCGCCSCKEGCERSLMKESADADVEAIAAIIGMACRLKSPEKGNWGAAGGVDLDRHRDPFDKALEKEGLAQIRSSHPILCLKKASEMRKPVFIHVSTELQIVKGPARVSPLAGPRSS